MAALVGWIDRDANFHRKTLVIFPYLNMRRSTVESHISTSSSEWLAVVVVSNIGAMLCNY